MLHPKQLNIYCIKFYYYFSVSEMLEASSVFSGYLCLYKCFGMGSFFSLNYAAKHHSIILSLNKTYHIVKVIFFSRKPTKNPNVFSFCVQTGDLIKGC